ncbi:unnamed protein product [Pedinophyceae sp. YPF-701]|nr:unnamed protein product [Pedinophyceae sp. YPF-701]
MTRIGVQVENIREGLDAEVPTGPDEAMQVHSSIDVSEVALTLHTTQLVDMQRFARKCELIPYRVKYGRFRPQGWRPSKAARAGQTQGSWTKAWLYAGRSVLADVRARQGFISAAQLSALKRRRERYIGIWTEHILAQRGGAAVELTSGPEIELAQLETELPVETILIFRALAEQQVAEQMNAQPGVVAPNRVGGLFASVSSMIREGARAGASIFGIGGRARPDGTSNERWSRDEDVEHLARYLEAVISSKKDHDGSRPKALLTLDAEVSRVNAVFGMPARSACGRQDAGRSAFTKAFQFRVERVSVAQAEYGCARALHACCQSISAHGAHERNCIITTSSESAGRSAPAFSCTAGAGECSTDWAQLRTCGKLLRFWNRHDERREPAAAAGSSEASEPSEWDDEKSQSQREMPEATSNTVHVRIPSVFVHLDGASMLRLAVFASAASKGVESEHSLQSMWALNRINSERVQLLETSQQCVGRIGPTATDVRIQVGSMTVALEGEQQGRALSITSAPALIVGANEISIHVLPDVNRLHAAALCRKLVDSSTSAARIPQSSWDSTRDEVLDRLIYARSMIDIGEVSMSLGYASPVRDIQPSGCVPAPYEISRRFKVLSLDCSLLIDSHRLRYDGRLPSSRIKLQTRQVDFEFGMKSASHLLKFYTSFVPSLIESPLLNELHADGALDRNDAAPPRSASEFSAAVEHCDLCFKLTEGPATRTIAVGVERFDISTSSSAYVGSNMTGKAARIVTKLFAPLAREGNDMQALATILNSQVCDVSFIHETRVGRNGPSQLAQTLGLTIRSAEAFTSPAVPASCLMRLHPSERCDEERCVHVMSTARHGQAFGGTVAHIDVDIGRIDIGSLSLLTTARFLSDALPALVDDIAWPDVRDSVRVSKQLQAALDGARHIQVQQDKAALTADCDTSSSIASLHSVHSSMSSEAAGDEEDIMLWSMQLESSGALLFHILAQDGSLPGAQHGPSCSHGAAPACPRGEGLGIFLLVRGITAHVPEVDPYKICRPRGAAWQIGWQLLTLRGVTAGVCAASRLGAMSAHASADRGWADVGAIVYDQPQLTAKLHAEHHAFNERRASRPHLGVVELSLDIPRIACDPLVLASEEAMTAFLCDTQLPDLRRDIDAVVASMTEVIIRVEEEGAIVTKTAGSPRRSVPNFRLQLPDLPIDIRAQVLLERAELELSTTDRSVAPPQRRSMVRVLAEGGEISCTVQTSWEVLVFFGLSKTQIERDHQGVANASPVGAAVEGGHGSDYPVVALLTESPPVPESSAASGTRPAAPICVHSSLRFCVDDSRHVERLITAVHCSNIFVLCSSQSIAVAEAVSHETLTLSQRWHELTRTKRRVQRDTSTDARGGELSVNLSDLQQYGLPVVQLEWRAPRVELMLHHGGIAPLTVFRGAIVDTVTRSWRAGMSIVVQDTTTCLRADTELQRFDFESTLSGVVVDVWHGCQACGDDAERVCDWRGGDLSVRVERTKNSMIVASKVVGSAKRCAFVCSLRACSTITSILNDAVHITARQGVCQEPMRRQAFISVEKRQNPSQDMRDTWIGRSVPVIGIPFTLDADWYLETVSFCGVRQAGSIDDRSPPLLTASTKAEGSINVASGDVRQEDWQVHAKASWTSSLSCASQDQVVTNVISGITMSTVIDARGMHGLPVDAMNVVLSVRSSDGSVRALVTLSPRLTDAANWAQEVAALFSTHAMRAVLFLRDDVRACDKTESPLSPARAETKGAPFCILESRLQEPVVASLTCDGSELWSGVAPAGRALPLVWDAAGATTAGGLPRVTSEVHISVFELQDASEFNTRDRESMICGACIGRAAATSARGSNWKLRAANAADSLVLFQVCSAPGEALRIAVYPRIVVTSHLQHHLLQIDFAEPQDRAPSHETRHVLHSGSQLCVNSRVARAVLSAQSLHLRVCAASCTRRALRSSCQGSDVRIDVSDALSETALPPRSHGQRTSWRLIELERPDDGLDGYSGADDKLPVHVAYSRDSLGVLGVEFLAPLVSFSWFPFDLRLAISGPAAVTHLILRSATACGSSIEPAIDYHRFSASLGSDPSTWRVSVESQSALDAQAVSSWARLQKTSENDFSAQLKLEWLNRQLVARLEVSLPPHGAPIVRILPSSVIFNMSGSSVEAISSDRYPAHDQPGFIIQANASCFPTVQGGLYLRGAGQERWNGPIKLGSCRGSLPFLSTTGPLQAACHEVAYGTPSLTIRGSPAQACDLVVSNATLQQLVVRQQGNGATCSHQELALAPGACAGVQWCADRTCPTQLTLSPPQVSDRHGSVMLDLSPILQPSSFSLRSARKRKLSCVPVSGGSRSLMRWALGYSFKEPCGLVAHTCVQNGTLHVTISDHSNPPASNWNSDLGSAGSQAQLQRNASMTSKVDFRFSIPHLVFNVQDFDGGHVADVDMAGLRFETRGVIPHHADSRGVVVDFEAFLLRLRISGDKRPSAEAVLQWPARWRPPCLLPTRRIAKVEPALRSSVRFVLCPLDVSRIDVPNVSVSFGPLSLCPDVHLVRMATETLRSVRQTQESLVHATPSPPQLTALAFKARRSQGLHVRMMDVRVAPLHVLVGVQTRGGRAHNDLAHAACSLSIRPVMGLPLGLKLTDAYIMPEDVMDALLPQVMLQARMTLLCILDTAATSALPTSATALCWPASNAVASLLLAFGVAACADAQHFQQDIHRLKLVVSRGACDVAWALLNVMRTSSFSAARWMRALPGLHTPKGHMYDVFSYLGRRCSDLQGLAVESQDQDDV